MKFALVVLALVCCVAGHAGPIASITLFNQQSYDFDTGTIGSLSGGEFYYLAQNCAFCNLPDVDKFWANNAQPGLQDVGAIPLLSISTIPASGYNQFGVSAVVGDSYISLAAPGEAAGKYVFFQVTSKTPSSVTLNWIQSSVAPAAVPEPGCFGLGLAGVISVLLRRRRRGSLGWLLLRP